MKKAVPGKSIVLYALSLLIPAVIIMAAMAGLHITPFGDQTLIISDANGLYINSLSYAGRLFRGLEGITYSFKKGLGGNMMAYISGTMLNPFYLFFSFFDILDFPIAYSLVCLCNLSFCGLTMYILLKDCYGHKASNLIFSTSYALMGFNVAYAWQVIFFTGVHTLPLMVLGLKRIFERRRPWLYILSLAYALLTDFYFGYTLCVVSVLIFFAVLWLEKDRCQGQKLSLFIRYAAASVCGGLIPIVSWLPGVLSLVGGRLNQTGLSDFSFAENMPFLEIFSKLFSGANTPSELVDGLPNIYVGLLPVALVILYFLNKRVDKRKKTVAAILLGFYLAMFYIVAFDMLMHGGTVTNWFNYRYSFIFSFLMLLVAAYQWKYVEETPNRQLKQCLAIMVITTLIVFTKRYSFVIAGCVLLDYGILLLMAMTLAMHRKDPVKNPFKLAERLVLVLTCFSLFTNFILCTHNLLKNDWNIKASDYKDTVAKVNPLVWGAKLADDGFYRMEVTKQRSGNCGNDSFLYGYNGVGHGGSHERNFVREGLNKLGVHRFDMRNYYEEGIPAATDALLGVKFLIANEDMAEEKQYLRMTDMEKMGLTTEGDNFDLFQCDYSLPIGFLSGKTIEDIQLTYDDVFDNLNRVWSAISDTEDKAFIEENDITFTTRNMIDTRAMTADEGKEILKTYEKNPDAEHSSDSASSESDSGDHGLTTHIIMDEAPMFNSSVEFSFEAKQDGPVYVYHRAALADSTYGAAEPVLKYMGYHHQGDTVRGYLLVEGDYVNRVTFEEFAGRFRAAYADLDALQRMSEKVRQQPTTIAKIKENHLTGTMTANQGQNMLFTIPWDQGWTCYVDGDRSEIKQVLGVFMAVDIPAGEHHFEMTYEPDGLHIGIIISIGALMLTVLFLIFGFRRSDKIVLTDTCPQTVDGTKAVSVQENEVSAHDSL